MALPKEVIVIESTTELKQLLKKSKPLFQPRLRMLLFIKNSQKPLSKKELSKLVYCSATSIQTWRSLYLKGGISELLSHTTTASRPSIFTSEEHSKLEQKLRDPKNGLQGYKELHRWVTKHIKTGVKENSLMVYCRQKFGTKIKVVRKSHVKKDEEAVETFKKNFSCHLAKDLKSKPQYKNFNIYFQDESRFGLFTKNGKSLTASQSVHSNRFLNLPIFLEIFHQKMAIVY